MGRALRPNEHHVPLEALTADKSLVLLQHWVPERRFTTLNGYEYELYAFRRR